MKVTESELHDHGECKAFFEYLSEYIDQELDHDMCRKIETHLKDCNCCNTCLLTLKKTIEICRRYETYPVPETLSAKLRIKN